MNFIVKVSELAHELRLLVGIAQRKTTIPVLSNVLIEAEGERIRMTATDLDVSLRCVCPARVSLEGSVTAPAAKLLDYVAALPSGDVEIGEQKNSWIGLTAGRSKARMAGIPRESFPELPTRPAEAGVEIPLAEFVAMAVTTGFAISKEQSRFVLDAALLTIGPAGRVMVATDGHRLAWMRTPTEGGEAELAALLPARVIRMMVKIAAESKHDELLRIAEDDNNLFFEIGERALTARKLTGNFPDYRQVLPKQHPLEVKVSRVELLAAIERVGTFADGESRGMTVAVSRGEIVLRAASEAGDSEESVAAEYVGSQVEARFNADYLAEFLAKVADERVTLMLKGAKSAGEMRPCGELAERCRYVVMPMMMPAR